MPTTSSISTMSTLHRLYKQCFHNVAYINNVSHYVAYIYNESTTSSISTMSPLRRKQCLSYIVYINTVSTTLSISTMSHLRRLYQQSLKLPFDIKKVQVGKDQENAQSEKDSHSKNQGGKKPTIRYLYHENIS